MTTPLQNMLRRAAAEDLVYEREFDGLFIYVYTHSTQIKKLWNATTRQARGLILDGDGNVVARPFDKFFNIFEMPETEPPNFPKRPYCIWEKVDGSLGIIFWNPIRESWDISTKGSLHSPQADYARAELLPRYVANLGKWMNPKFTVLTEIIYPDNRIVVDYGGVEELRLLAVRNKNTGDYEHPKRVMDVVSSQLGMKAANGYGYESYEEGDAEALTNLRMEENMEGWVIEWDNGFRVKVKNPWYLRIHRALDSKTTKRIIELLEGGEWRHFWESLPKELQKDFDDLYSEIRTAMWDIERRAQDAWSACSDAKMVTTGRNGRIGRRDFALWVQTNVEAELHPIMYSILDGRDWKHHVFSILKSKFL